jgi:hypothetical protein
VSDNLNKDEVATELHDGFVANPNVLTDPRMREQLHAQRAERGLPRDAVWDGSWGAASGQRTF